MDVLPRLSRRALLRGGGLGLGALAAGNLLGALPAGAAGRSRVAADAAPLQLARVWPRSDQQAGALAAFDDTHRVFADGSAEYLLWPGDRGRLDALGVDYAITVDDVLAGQRIGRGASSVPVQPGQREDYRRLVDYEDDLRDLARRFPDQARVFVLPERTLEGRQVLGIEIATNVHGARDGRPTALFDGTHHAREWPSAELPLMFAFDLLENYGTDPRVTRIVDTQRTLIVPVVNPDGFTYSRASLVQSDDSTLPGQAVSLGLGIAGAESYWRKNRRSFSNVTLPTGTNPDAYGTDPNRNYPFFWGGSGSSATQVNQTHRGSAPYAEPESRNIAGLILANQITAMVTNHTFGKLCMRPWGAVPDASPDTRLQAAVGERMVAFNGYQNILARQLYNTAGTSRDWAFAAVRTLVWTFEHGEEFHGPYLDTVPEMYAVNRDPFLIVCELAGDASAHALLHGRVVDAAGNPLDATVRTRKAFLTAPFSGQPVPEVLDAAILAGDDGTFTYHINPTTRPTPAIPAGVTEAVDVVVSAPGKAPVTIPVTLGRGEAADLGTVTLR
jgi:hypothetical protein